MILVLLSDENVFFGDSRSATGARVSKNSAKILCVLPKRHFLERPFDFSGDFYIIAFMITLEVKSRQPKESLVKMRQTGTIPAVFYGPKEKSTPVSVSEKDFQKVWKQAGESSVVTLTGEFGEHDALIHDIDKDPLTGVIRHADFYVIEKGKKIKVNIPIEFTGVSSAVKDLGGVLVKVLHEIEIEAMPKDLPHSLEADISKLTDFESRVLASDIKLPSGVVLITKEDEIIALAAVPKEEKEEEVAPVDLSAIEVEKKGKEAKEGEEGGDAKEESSPEAKK